MSIFKLYINKFKNFQSQNILPVFVKVKKENKGIKKKYLFNLFDFLRKIKNI